MTRFWCPWCGATASAPNPDDRVPCLRCAAEFLRLFRFAPRTDMTPLRAGEEPGEPVASRKQFVFYDERADEVGRTAVVAGRGRRRQRPRSA